MFALSSLPRHRRPVTYREDSRKDFKSLAACARIGAENTCSHSACPKHLPNLYADGMAKHVSDVYGTGSFSPRWTVQVSS